MVANLDSDGIDHCSFAQLGQFDQKVETALIVLVCESVISGAVFVPFRRKNVVGHRDR